MSDYFGQSPDGYQKPLYGASNLSDVVDKPAALVNLGAASADDVLKAANPIGTIIAFYGSVAPYGYLPCSGQTVSSSTFPSLVTFLGGTTSATLPDLRGEFLRGWDNGRGIDAGRAIRTTQADLVKTPVSIALALANWASTGSTAGLGFMTTSGAVQVPAGSETRPRNVSVLYCIKAYDTPVSAGILNVAQLAGDLTSQIALKTNFSNFTGSNQQMGTPGYQKLPGGLVMQWGKSTVGASSVSILSYPIAFTSIFHLGVSIGQASLSAAATPCAGIEQYQGISLTQFVLQNTYSASPLIIYWTALGTV